MPALHPPAGVRLFVGGHSAGDWFASSSARADTELSPPELAQHFASQLTEAGWSVKNGEQTPGFASAIAEKMGDSGQRWLGLLTVIRIPEIGTHQLEFQVMHPEKVREDRDRWRRSRP